MLVHSIADPASLAPLGAVSKFNIEPEFLEYLFDLGRAGGNLVAGRDVRLGRRHRARIDIRARFL